ncbi:MAG: ribonuclease P protein component [Pseudomonadota bacterium]
MSKIHLETLKSRADFIRLAKRGRKSFTHGLGLQVLPGTDLKAQPNPSDARVASQTIRVGITATRKQIGNAVRRNRAKRRLRALIRQTLVPNAKCGLDYVLIARPKTMTRAFAMLEHDLLYALKKTGAAALTKADHQNARQFIHPTLSE